ncbi:MAG: acetylornithine/N-succinyldiaminopimelate aminotransferase [Saprospiraceae bacterium]|jgi:acetylornithine/N-succinyldiaminopimelate aminotransferase
MISSRALFHSYVAQTSPKPIGLEIVDADGVYLFGSKGERYLDLIAGISVSNVGHNHPAIVNAVKEQADKYMHLMVYGEYIQTPQVKLAEKIAGLLPESLNNIYFVNSGSEANEGALKLAKRYTGKRKIIYCNNAYHGSTQGVLSVIGHEDFKKPFEPLLPDTHAITFNKIRDLDIICENTAAVIIEPVQGEAGVIMPDKNFMRALRERCTEKGTMLIFDEVQTGFGRTGTFWGKNHTGITPDIMTIAKGMGGGMPIGAFISSSEIMHCLTHHPVLGHITTFGGHPVCCAASLACIETIQGENLLDGVSEKEALFKSLLKHPAIIELRGVGLFLSIEFKDSDFNFAVIEECIKKGVITDWFLFNDKCLRIAPPLIISESEIKQACEVIVQAIAVVCNR